MPCCPLASLEEHAPDEWVEAAVMQAVLPRRWLP